MDNNELITVTAQDWADEIQRAQKSERELKAQLATANGKVKVLDFQLSNATQKEIDLTLELATATAQVKELEGQVSVRDKLIIQAQKQINDLHEQLSSIE